MNRTSTTKLQTLESIERIFKNPIGYNDKGRPKYFVTFPYPYMNGKMHLGHLYSFSKSEFMARYKCMKGFDVFLPFAFHGTGMPISAAAKKLCEGDQSTVQLLNSIGIKDVEPFKDAKYWLHYFPPLATDVMTKFQSYINWNHSFTTTDLNPYYDSFVKWQFCRLEKYISYGKKETIYCTITNQPCLDHDRRTGEGVIPVLVNMRMVSLGDTYFCTRVKDRTNSDETATAPRAKTITVGRIARFFKVDINGKSCIIDHWALENMRYQEFKLEVSGEIKIEEIPGHKSYKFVYLDRDQPPVINFCDPADPSLAYYEPEKEVQGRAGSKCVVASVNQWFLDYDNVQWKKKVAECIEDMNCLSETRRMLLDALGWIDKWGFSRTFGLGTSFKEYVIDSLSDSTIYMAFYLAKPELFSDLYGLERKIEPECLTNAAWDYIFNFSDVNPCDDEKELVLERARNAFVRYYPVDLRVSGKDLIKNHLLFYIFHHVAIFPRNCWPKRIFTNGHLLLNNAKMSKSEGNFLTAEDSIKLFGANVTRIVLADAGDFNEDANFSQALADTYILKIYTFVKYVESFIKEVIHTLPDKEDYRTAVEQKVTSFADRYERYKSNSCSKTPGISFADELLKDGVDFLVDKCDQLYESMTYRDAIKYGFHEFKTLMELCMSLNCSSEAMLYAIKNNLLVMYPVITSICDYLLEKYFKKVLVWPVSIVRKDNVYLGLEWFRKFSKNLASKAARMQKKNIRIYVGTVVPEWKTLVQDIDPDDIVALRKFFAKFEINPKKGMSFVKDHVKYNFDEHRLLSGLKTSLEKKLGVNIEILTCVDGKGEPYEPAIEFY